MLEGRLHAGTAWRNPFSIFSLEREKVRWRAVQVIGELAATMVVRAACPDVGVSPGGGGTKLSG